MKLSIRIVLSAIVLCAVAGLTDTAQAAESDSLRAEFMFSASVRNPSEGTYETTSGDTVKTPFDFELATGLDGEYGPARFSFSEVWRRENNEKYWNHEASLDLAQKYAKTGFRFLDINGGSKQERVAVLLEGIVKGWVGIGGSYQWTEIDYGERELRNGKPYARISLAKNRHTFMGVHLNLSAEYNYNPDVYTLSSRVDIRNLTRGRYALVPFFKWNREAYKGQDPKDAYQAKVALTIQI